METTSLHELLTNVLFDGTVRTAFQASPESFLTEHGYQGLDAADVDEALLLFADELPPAQAEVLIDLDTGHPEVGGLSGAAEGVGRLADTIDERGAEWLQAGEVEPVVDPIDLSSLGTEAAELTELDSLGDLADFGTGRGVDEVDDAAELRRLKDDSDDDGSGLDLADESEGIDDAFDDLVDLKVELTDPDSLLEDDADPFSLDELDDLGEFGEGSIVDEPDDLDMDPA